MTLGIPGLGIGLLKGIDPDAAAWAASVVAAGGTYKGSTLSALSSFVRSAKGAGYWTKISRINLFCGDQLAAALVPLKAGSGNATETNVSFVSGDYTEATGLTGNGTTKYLRTGFIASGNLTGNDAHLSIYNRGAQKGPVGATTGAAETYLYGPYSDGKAYVNIGSAGSAVSAVLGTPVGFVVGTRTGATAEDVYRNGSNAGTSAVASTTALNANEAYVFALNNGGVALDISSMACGGYSIGAGLTQAEVTAFYNNMQTFQTALGRNV